MNRVPHPILHIDGAHGEGGGQLVRTAVALAAISGRPLHMRNIRARRAKPGLAAQHLTAVRAVAALCGATVEGAAVGSGELTFVPQTVRGGDYRFDVGTAGSITLVLQALLPVLLAADRPSRVTIRGGTDVRGAPPMDYLACVVLPLLARMGAETLMIVERRGYFPRGDGSVTLETRPATLKPLVIDQAGDLRHIAGIAHVANLPADIARRMSRSAADSLQGMGVPVQIDARILGPDAALGMGGAIVLWAKTEHALLGAARVAQRGVPAEGLGTDAAEELRADIACDAAVDVHACDQMLIHLALADAASRLTCRCLSNHARSAIWLIEQFLPVRFHVTEADAGASIEVEPCGSARPHRIARATTDCPRPTP